MELGYSTLVRQLHEHGWVLRIPRPWPLPPNDEVWEQRRAEFRPRLQALLQDPQAVVFFQDECGIEGDPRPRSTWALKGSHPLTKQTGAHVRLNILAAAAPATGACSALIFDGCDSAVFQIFLDTLAADVPRWRVNVTIWCSTTPAGTKPNGSLASLRAGLPFALQPGL